MDENIEKNVPEEGGEAVLETENTSGASASSESSSLPVTPEDEIVTDVSEDDIVTENPEGETGTDIPEGKVTAETTKNLAGTEAPSETRGGESVGITGVDLAVSLCEAVVRGAGDKPFHGGVRPDNISVQGKTVSLGSRLEHTVGEFTPQELEYMAPELFWDGIRVPASDVYSIGLILYSLYNYGRLPFWPGSGAVTPNARASALQKRMSDEPIQPPAKADNELADIILRALSFRTEERWKDVAELKSALSGCAVEETSADISLAMTGILNRSVETRPAEDAAMKEKTASYYDDNDPPRIPRRPDKRRDLRWLWISLLAVILVGAAVLLIVNDRAGNTPGSYASPAPETTASPVATASPAPTAEPTATPTPSGERYIVVKDDCSWSEAVERCRAMGGFLAVPKDQEELDTLRIYLDREEDDMVYLWLGASRQDDHSWATTEGETLTWFDFWAPNEPSGFDSGDGQPENYLMIWRMDDTWLCNDSREDPVRDFGAFYSGKMGYICQMW